jgi:hypothetical protein
LVKTNFEGDVLFAKTFGNSGFMIYQGHSIVQTSDNGFAIGGYWYIPGSPTNMGDPIVIKTDSLGNQEWMKNLGGPYQDNKAMICLDNYGNIIIGTNYAFKMSGSEPESKINVIKLDNEGNIIWNKKYGNVFLNNYLLNIRILNNGHILCTGFYNPPGLMDFEGWIITLKSNGDSIWQRNYRILLGENSDNYLYDVIQTSGDGLLACGYVYPSSPDTGTQDVWVIKLDSIGCEYPFCDTTVGVADPESIVSEAGLRVWPNPVYDQLTVDGWQLTVGSRQSTIRVLEIYDLYGRKVEEIIIPPLQQSLKLDVSAWNTGVYVAVLWSEERIVGRAKFVVQR